MSVHDHPIQIARRHLPQGAELANIDGPAPRPAVLAADITGDRIPEITAVYRLQGELFVMVLVYREGRYEAAARMKGPGYGVTYMAAAPVLQPGTSNLVIGWRIGSIWSKLSVYAWSGEVLTDAAPSGMSFSFVHVEDMPGTNGRDGQAEIALWIHDTGDAYRVNVVRWSRGAFVPAPDAYRYYFPTVVRYYEGLTRKHPDYSFYWYYLADAQYRAGMPEPALASVRRALSFPDPYPSKETLSELERNIEQTLHGSGRFSQPSGLFPASLKTTHGTKWGYIDAEGKLVIPARFDDARDFQQNGLAVAAAGEKYGVIDSAGRFVVQPRYQWINPFSEGRAVANDEQGFRLINQEGQVLTRKAYAFVADMHEGRAVFNEAAGGNGSSRYGYLDPEGHEAIAAQYAEAGDFSGGKAVVKIQENEYALIDRNGRRLATYPYAYVGPIGEGLLAFQKDAGGKYGYIDEKGSVVIPAAFTSAFPFHQGCAIVNTAEDYQSRFGVIDRQGEWVIRPEYDDIRDLNEGRFALGRAVNPQQPFIGSVYAIADDHGRRLTEFSYRDVSNFEGGLASAYDRRFTFLIDRSGQPAPGYPRVSGSGTLQRESEGLIKAFVDQRLSYIDRSGRVIWRQNTVIPLQPPYLVKEEKYKPNPDYIVYYPVVEGIKDPAAQRSVNAKLKELSQVKHVPADQTLDYTYTGDFQVLFYKQNLLVLELDGYRYPLGAAHGMPTKAFALIDLATGRMYGLKDLFKPGSDYVKRLSDIVGRQIEEDPQYSYVFPGSYKGISPDQSFCVTEDALHLVFEPYEIAPYAAGFPTFTIPFAQIRDLIDTTGAFWKAFH